MGKKDYKTFNNICKFCGDEFKAHRIAVICPNCENKICKEYIHGNSTYKLGNKYNVSGETIRRILKRNNVKRRMKGIVKLSKHDEEQICKEYGRGNGIYALEKKLEINNETIRRTLIKNKIPRNKNLPSELDQNDELELCKKYELGAEIGDLSKEYGLSLYKLRIIFKNNNVPQRQSYKLDKLIQEGICNEYRNGKSTLELGDKYGVNPSTIWRILIKNGIPRRKSFEHVWQGGISFEPYCPKFNNEFKERVRKFWGRRCGICGKSEKTNARKLSVHHVNYDKKVCCNDGVPLFIPLCGSCHSRTNSNRNHWEEILTNYIMIYFNGYSF